MLVNIGYGNVVNMDRVVSIVRADAAPIKRMIQVAKDENLAIDGMLFYQHCFLKRLRTECLKIQ